MFAARVCGALRGRSCAVTAGTPHARFLLQTPLLDPLLKFRLKLGLASPHRPFDVGVTPHVRFSPVWNQDCQTQSSNNVQIREKQSHRLGNGAPLPDLLCGGVSSGSRRRVQACPGAQGHVFLSGLTRDFYCSRETVSVCMKHTTLARTSSTLTDPPTIFLPQY